MQLYQNNNTYRLLLNKTIKNFKNIDLIVLRFLLSRFPSYI